MDKSSENRMIRGGWHNEGIRGKAHDLGKPTVEPGNSEMNQTTKLCCHSSTIDEDKATAKGCGALDNDAHLWTSMKMPLRARMLTCERV